ncbi:MAG: sulfotransferase [Gomphosphaeria aponina SAG 52.96 = DSM 107014]|uniref:Sulfotransferase n=1 Tax=Gomphosphaeria aponina SAG 52.96 = DSM 107014 TaxID=1521640 RepID=A0A941GT86_9CHRO|nr:sulfotransferase [Gomphosphaeria aponina SAG 52.96 = DSM 107014]
METPETNVKSSENPIFVVGLSRSGTTLMTDILNRHSEVYIAPETHYFDDLRLKMESHSLNSFSAEQIKDIEDYFLAQTHKFYMSGGDPEQGWMERIELRKLAQSINNNIDAYFEAYCKLCTKRKNKIKWGEKTPRHIFNIKEILTCYPNAKIVCMIRHPGAVVASYRDFAKNEWSNNERVASENKRIQKSYNIITISLLWRGAFNAALTALEEFGENKIYIQRFEDLVLNPELTMEKLTKWLSLEYQPSMLEVSLVGSSYADTWAVSGVGFAEESASRWREKLSDPEIAVVQYCCGNLLSRGNYEKEKTNASLLNIIWFWITFPLAALQAVIANQERIGNIPKYIWSRLVLAFK